MEDNGQENVVVWGAGALLPRGLGGVAVRAVAAGKEHVMVQLMAGEVLAAGDNTYGQLALSDRTLKAVSQFRVVPDLFAKQVACGHFHTLFLSVEGDALVSGRNDSGQLGLSDYKHRWVATPLPHKHAISAFAGSNNSALLAKNGRLLVAGCNQHRQLALDARNYS
jgi:alpha-tubulin suppressor-like RCC1 family protein